MFTNLRFREETYRGMIACVTIFVLAGWTISCFLITNVNHKGCAMYVHGGGISLSDLGNSYAKWTEENETDLFRPCLNPPTLRSPVFDLEPDLNIEAPWWLMLIVPMSLIVVVEIRAKKDKERAAEGPLGARNQPPAGS